MAPRDRRATALPIASSSWFSSMPAATGHNLSNARIVERWAHSKHTRVPSRDELPSSSNNSISAVTSEIQHELAQELRVTRRRGQADAAEGAAEPQMELQRRVVPPFIEGPIAEHEPTRGVTGRPTVTSNAHVWLPPKASLTCPPTSALVSRVPFLPERFD